MLFQTMITVLGMLILSTLVNTQDSCSKCFYNSGRKFQCHCFGQCDSEGRCIGNSSDCTYGWFGFGCQYQNLAENYKTVVEPSTAGGLLIGAQNSLCNNDSTLQYLNVTWNTSLPFTWMRLKLADNENLYNFTLSFVLPNTASKILCTNQTIFQVDEATFDIYCTINEATSGFKIEGKIVGSVCSLKVSGGRNVALFQNTSQSTTVPTNLIGYGSQVAVDGVVIASCDYNGCSHTADDDLHPSWSVTFDKPYDVKRFTIFNRFDHEEIKVPDRLKHFELEALDNQSSTIFYYIDSQETTKQFYTVLYFNKSLVYGVRINQTQKYRSADKNPYVSINEFQAFGECKPGYWALNCSQQCQSNCNRVCLMDDGSCNSICVGYSNPPTCSTECIYNKWGINCKRDCKRDCYNSTCDNLTGQCIKGCNGFSNPPSCTQACLNQNFGHNCSELCPVNCLNRSCIATTGFCILCKPGYQGESCDKPCNTSWYGANCSHRCNVACLGQDCNGTTGVCLNCAAGKYGDQCIDCPSGRFGDNCGQNCSVNCRNGTTCNKVNGSCPLGCEPGYEGSDCSVVVKPEATQNSSKEDNVGIIVGPVIGGVVFLALIILGILFCRRRTFRSKKQDVLTVRGNDSRSFTDKSTNVQNAHKKTISPVPSIATTKETSGYYNTIAIVVEDKRINVNDLHKFINSHTSGQFLDQFKTLPDTPHVTTEAGLKEENRNKNRFKNICPYDHSRVHLEINTEKNETDYINASYIEGYNNEIKFIASQGPSTATLQDFVRMLWEQKTEKVVMLTNVIEEGKTKCEKYWADDDKKVFGDLKIKHLATQTFAHYTVRQLELTKKNHPTHKVTQFHFTSWPDKSVPAASWSIVEFQQHVFATPTLTPIVVHCSAGVGRTGTFIALYNVTREAKETGHINFYDTVIKLRQDRMLMVQTAEQYEFLHKAALASTVCTGATVYVDNFKEKPNGLQEKTLSGKSKMNIEYKAICNVCEVYKKRLPDNETGKGDNVYQNAESSVHRLKNRFPEIFPNDLYRPRLTGYSAEDGDYINAVVLPSLRKIDQQIITQLPMPDTVNDFWRLVTQYNISLVLAFEVDSMEDDKTFGHYIPTSKNPVLTCSPFEIKSVYVKDESFWQEQKLNVCLEKRKSSPSVTPMLKENHELVHMKFRSYDLKLSHFLSFIKEARKHTTLDERILYMCKNGALYSGLACVLSSLLDKMDNDSSLNIPLVVGSVKSIRCEVIPSSDQYELLYQMLHQYSESSEYSNAQTRLESSKNTIPRISLKKTEADVNVYANLN